MNPTKKNISSFLERFVNVMDSAFKIPGTNIRFGFDAIIGLIPGVGDAVSFLVSGALVLLMASKGVSTKTAVKMLGNIALDYVIGAIPVLGDLFDFGFKANQRNLKLLKKHHDSQVSDELTIPNVKGILLGITAFLVLFITIGFHLMWQLSNFLLELFA